MPSSDEGGTAEFGELVSSGEYRLRVQDLMIIAEAVSEEHVV